MSDLREAVKTLLCKYGMWAAKDDYQSEAVDDIIAAFAEAMLSDKALDAGARTLYDYGNGWEDFEGRAMDVIEAALKAIGATED